MKKITVLLLTLVMLFAFPTVAFAEEKATDSVAAAEFEEEVTAAPEVTDVPVEIDPEKLEIGVPVTEEIIPETDNVVDNPDTGVALAIIPLVIAIVALILFRKRKKK